MFKQLTWEDRLKIEKALKQGLKAPAIAKMLRVHHSTIYDELKRGRYTHLNSDLTTEERYSPEIAQQTRDAHQKGKGPNLKIGNDHELAAYIEKMIVENGYSPAAVLADIERKGLKFKTKICEKTIYNYIEGGVFLCLEKKHLPNRGRRKRPYDKIKRKKAARAPKGDSIEKRPQEINDRNTFGHWEMDCVVGARKTKPVLLVLSERLTRREIVIKMKDKTTDSVVKALNRLERKFGKRFRKVFKTITVDNGSEFQDCAGMEASVSGDGEKRTKIYYCHPYSAYERGTNENINKMIRRFFPKGTDFRETSEDYIQRVEDWINDYPREVLDFKSSEALFRAYLSAAA